MSNVKRQLIGILAPVVAALGLWSLITSDWYESAAAKAGDLVVKLFTAILNSA